MATSAVSASSTLGSAFTSLGGPWRSVNLGLVALLLNLIVGLSVSAVTTTIGRRPRKTGVAEARAAS
jgi:hypothetical protein